MTKLTSRLAKGANPQADTFKREDEIDEPVFQPKELRRMRSRLWRNSVRLFANDKDYI